MRGGGHRDVIWPQNRSCDVNFKQFIQLIAYCLAFPITLEFYADFLFYFIKATELLNWYILYGYWDDGCEKVLNKIQ